MRLTTNWTTSTGLAKSPTARTAKTGKLFTVVYDTKTQPAMPANMELTEGGQRIKLKMDNWIVK